MDKNTAALPGAIRGKLKEFQESCWARAASLNTSCCYLGNYTGVTWILKMEGFEKGGFLSKKIIFRCRETFSAGAHFGS